MAANPKRDYYATTAAVVEVAQKFVGTAVAVSLAEHSADVSTPKSRYRPCESGGSTSARKYEYNIPHPTAASFSAPVHAPVVSARFGP